MLSKGATMPGTPHGLELRRAKRSAEKWKVKAEELQKDHVVMKQIVHESIHNENIMEVQMGRLKHNRDVLHSQMKLREKGLHLRQHKEEHFRSDIAELHTRIDEMSRMIRHKEVELQALRFKDAAQKQEISALKARLGNRSKSLHQIPDHKMDTIGKSKTLPPKKSVRLPNLTTQVKSLSTGKDSDKDSQFGTDKSDGRMTEDDNFSRVSTIDLNLNQPEDHVMNCTMVEKTTGSAGACLCLQNAKLTIPMDAVSVPCRIAMSSIDMTRQAIMIERMKAVGLFMLVKPRVFISLQPFDTTFSKVASLQLNIARDRTSKSKQSRVFVCFMQDINHHGDDFVWRAEKSSSMTAANDLPRASVVTIEINRLCGVAILELIADSTSRDSLTKFSDVNFLPNDTKMAPASGIVALTTAVLNNRSAICTFIVYALEGDEETLRLTCVNSNSSNKSTLLQKKNDRKVTHYGTSTTRLHVCDEEVLAFHFDKDTKCTGAMTLDLTKASGDGHRYRLPFFSCGSQDDDSDDSVNQDNVVHPTLMRVRRRIMAPHHMLEDNLCIINIKTTRRNFTL